MNNPLVSIIIPVYNRVDLIGETLDSILEQTYSNWECIVVDDGSDDDTIPIVQSYCNRDSRIKLYYRPDDKPKGGNAARNFGFEQAKGEYIQWFDSDDIMLPNLIEEIVNAFMPTYNFIICSGFVINNEKEKIRQLNITQTTNLFRDFVLWKEEIITNSVVFRRSFLIDKPLFNTQIFRGQEAEFFSRIFFQHSKLNYRLLEKPLFLYRQHSTTKTSDNIGYNNKFKKSQSFVYIENLKRAKQLKSNAAFNFLFGSLTDLYFKGLDHKDYNNSKYILKNLVISLISVNLLKSLELLLIGTALFLTKKGRYRYKKQWKLYRFEL